MFTLAVDQAKEIKNMVDSYRAEFANGTYSIISRYVLKANSLPELASIFDRLDSLISQLGHVNGGTTVEIEEELIPCLKRVLVWQRRDQAKRIEDYREGARHPDVLNLLEEELKPLENLLSQEPLRSAEPMSMPLLTEYLPISQIEKIPWGPPHLPDRTYDEKFGILQAPRQLFTDLEFYRRRCSLRARGVVIAYLDIDKFKNFNRQYLETKVDHLVLPRFMEAIEAHTYNHGFAYRFGGDEYVLMLPNMDRDLGAVFLDQLRRRVARIEYPETNNRTTISIGFVHVDADSHLTDREALGKANEAKNYAKKNRRNCIASYRGPHFDKSELYIFPRGRQSS